MLTNANLLNKSISNQMVNWEPQVYQAAFSEVEIKRIQRQMDKAQKKFYKKLPKVKGKK